MRRERALLLLIVAAFVASVAFAIAQHVPFENDETVYATQARAWAAGGPVTGVGLQRAPLLPAIGTLVYKAGARSEWPFRLTGLVFGSAAVVLLWALARAVAGPRAGLIAAAIFAGAPTIMQRSAQFMTDVPATALLLALALVLWHNRARAGPALLFAAPIAAAAFYIRYASILPIGLLVLIALVLWHDGLLRDPLLAAGTIVLFGVLLVPHALHAIHETGTPWGIVTYSTHSAGRRYVGQALLQYLAWLPFALAGPVAGIAMVAGIVAAAVRRSKAATFIVAPAAVDVLVLGLTEHGDERFIFFPVALLCVAGALFVSQIATPKRLVAAVLSLGLIGAGIYTVAHTGSARAHRLPPVLAGRAIAARAHGPCTVLAAEIAETTWYSGCSTYPFGAPAADFAVFYRIGGVRLTGQPKDPPAGAVQIASSRSGGRVVATVYALSGP
ncbi:MAG: hypothetical protein E6G04_08235 [Actinobacteria bacterium]|nr:MAG: hypothetical protein E6G04_08235 [Actinomycetota bacterium]